LAILRRCSWEEWIKVVGVVVERRKKGRGV